MLLVLAVLIPFLGALLAPFLARPLGARAGWPLALAFVPALALATLIPGAEQNTPAQGSAAWVPGLELSLSFRADGFSLFFALLVAVMGVLVMIYAASYLGPKERHGRFLRVFAAFRRRDVRLCFERQLDCDVRLLGTHFGRVIFTHRLLGYAPRRTRRGGQGACDYLGGGGWRC